MTTSAGVSRLLVGSGNEEVAEPDVDVAGPTARRPSNRWSCMVRMTHGR